MDFGRFHPEELLLFSERVYWRLFVLHNEALWPWQLLALAIGTGLILATLFPSRSRLRLGLAGLGLFWGITAWAYLEARYATINWAARYLVPVFLFQGAALLVALALPQRYWKVRPTSKASKSLSTGLVAYAVWLHPLTTLFHDTGLKGAEIFGLTPDSLAIATLATLGLFNNRLMRISLAILPTLWLLISAITLYTLGSIMTVVPLFSVALGCWVLLR